MTARVLELPDGHSSARFTEVFDGITGKRRVSVESGYSTHGLANLKLLHAWLGDQIQQMEDSPWPT